jgi:hypothetical protein
MRPLASEPDSPNDAAERTANQSPAARTDRTEVS